MIDSHEDGYKISQLQNLDIKVYHVFVQMFYLAKILKVRF